MPDWIFKNKPTAYATLASPSGTSGTTLTLTTGHGVRLPAPGAGQISTVRIENELITYTGNSGDVLTGVTRGAGATNHVAGTEVKNVLVEEWANAVTALSTDTKAALAGTSGTPQATNKFVTDADPRNSDARNPNSHSHVEGDTTGLVADLAARVLSTDSRLTDARTPTAHAISHKAAGGDVLAGGVGGYAPLDSGLLVPVANLGTGTPTGLKFLRDDRVWAVPAGGGGGSLTIEELDGTPSVAAATKLILPNGTVSVSGTEATYTPSGGGGGFTNPMTTKGDLIGALGGGGLYLDPPSTTVTGFNSNGGATSLQLASEFSCGLALPVTSLAFYRPAAGATPTNLYLWDTTSVGSPLIDLSTGIVDGGGVGWQSTPVPIGQQVTLVPNRHYRVGYWQPGGPFALSSSPPTPDASITYYDGQFYSLSFGAYPSSNNGAGYEGASVGLNESTTPGTATRIPGGSDGEYLVADSSATPGISYQVLTQTLTDGATINWNVKSGLRAQVTLGGNRTLGAPTNLISGQQYTLHVVQDGTGSRTLTWPSIAKWPGGAAPTLSTGAGKRDVFVFVTDGTNLYATAQAIDVR
jgi:hypothetical protein